MKKEIVLPSLFVLNAFLVGMAPKTSKAGSLTSANPDMDSVSYALVVDSNYWLSNNIMQKYADFIKGQNDSAAQDKKDTLSYEISWRGGAWVKYTSNDGSGFIRTGGSRTWRNMNPGAIRPGEISRQYGSCGSAGGFAVFPTEEHGMNALRGLLKSDKYINLTIAAAIRKWAPPSDNNNTKAYQQNLSRMTGLSLSKKINQLTPDELSRVADAIRTIEGWKSGKNEYFYPEKIMAKNDPKVLDLLKYRNMLQKQYSA